LGGNHIPDMVTIMESQGGAREWVRALSAAAGKAGAAPALGGASVRGR
jgi:hypothetical protein